MKQKMKRWLVVCLLTLCIILFPEYHLYAETSGSTVRELKTISDSVQTQNQGYTESDQSIQKQLLKKKKSGDYASGRIDLKKIREEAEYSHTKKNSGSKNIPVKSAAYADLYQSAYGALIDLNKGYTASITITTTSKDVAYIDWINEDAYYSVSWECTELTDSYCTLELTFTAAQKRDYTGIFYVGLMDESGNILASSFADILIINNYYVQDLGYCGDTSYYVGLQDKNSGYITEVIFGKGDMYDYKNSNTPWQGIKNKITAVGFSPFVSCVGSYAFDQCTALQGIIFGGRDDGGSDMKRIGERAFSFCSSLSGNLAIIDTVTTIDSAAFAYCSKVTAVNLPYSLQTLGYMAFSGCSSNHAFKINTANSYFSAANGVLFNKNETILCAFPSNASENTYRIPSTVVEIGGSAFTASSAKRTITIPSNVRTLKNYSFENLTATLIFEGNPPSFETNCFSGSNLTIQYPADLTGWTADIRKNYDGTVTWKGNSKSTPISSCSITLEYTRTTYTGSAKKPSVKVTYGGNTLKVNQDYTVSYSNNTNAGTASVSIYGKGNYTGSVSKSFSIGKASNRISAYNKIVDASSYQRSYSLWASASGGTISYRSNNSKVTVNSSGTVTVAANYVGTAVITITAGNSNYETVSSSIRVEVQKISNSISASNLTKVADTKAKSFSLGASAYGGVPLTYKSNNSNISVNKTTGKITVKKNYVGQAKITITAAAKGIYKSTSKTITVTIKLKKTTLSSVQALGSGKIKITWKKNVPADIYQIYISKDSKFPRGTHNKTENNVSTVSTTLGGLDRNKRYYVKIRVGKKDGKGGWNYGDWSDVKSIVIK